MKRLDQRIKTITAKKPAPHFFVSRPVYQNLAQRYQLKLQSLHWKPKQFPSKEDWKTLQEKQNQFQAHWMIWEKEPLPKTLNTLQAMGIKSIVFDPCANKPAHGNFISVMQNNIHNLEKSYR